MTLKEYTKKYKSKEYDLSCSESLLYAANEKYSLGLDEKTLNMMSGFSGGMFTENLCGIVASGNAVLGMLFTNGVAHQSPKLKEISIKWQEAFLAHKGSTNCKVLKEKYRSEVTGCTDLIIDGAGILEERAPSRHKKIS